VRILDWLDGDPGFRSMIMVGILILAWIVAMVWGK
jgi:hypothetical protein